MPKAAVVKGEPTVESALGGKDSAAMALYATLLKRVTGRGGVKSGVVEDAKKTCVHFVAGEGCAAFLGIHARKTGLLLTIISESPIKSPRIRKADQASRRRCYNDMLIGSTADLDAELLGWIAASHKLVSRAE